MSNDFASKLNIYNRRLKTPLMNRQPFPVGRASLIHSLANIRILPLMLAALLLLGCGGGEEEQPGNGETTAGAGTSGTKKYGGRYRMNIVRGNPNALDPVLINSKHADDIASQVFDRLIDLNEKLELVPEVAKALPTISEDGRIYRFDLRTDVFFHDNAAFPGGKGRRLVASDVVYSFTRCCDPRTRTVAFWAFKDKVKGATEYFEAINAKKPVDGIPGFRAINDSTFEIELIQPYAPFIYYLVNSLGDIVAREGVEKYKEDFFKNPVGSGPFMMERWLPDQELVLKRNPNYWGKDEAGNRLPFLDELHFLFIKDDKIQFDEFLSGTLEETFGIPTERFTDVYDPATRKPTQEYANYQVQAVPAMLTWFFDFLTTKPPFDNVDVRRAFNYAVDRERLVQFVLKNSPYAPAVHGLVPPVFPGYPVESIKGYTYDPVQAKQFMAKAGYPEGKGFPPVTMHIYTEPRLVQVAEAVQEMLKTTLNIQVDIKVIEFPQLISQSELAKLSFWGTRWYGDYPDPETYLNLVYGNTVPDSDTLPSYPNGSRYRSAEFDALFEKGVATIDNVARTNFYKQAEQVAINDAPILPLFYEQHYRLMQPYVRDNPLDAMARVDLKRVWLDTDETKPASPSPASPSPSPSPASPSPSPSSPSPSSPSPAPNPPSNAVDSGVKGAPALK